MIFNLETYITFSLYECILKQWTGWVGGRKHVKCASDLRFYCFRSVGVVGSTPVVVALRGCFGGK